MTEIRSMTREEWLAEGKKLFGDDFLTWKFQCPSCGHVQAVEDFRKFKDCGATPDDARQNCIGRFMDNGRDAFSKGKGPCNYAAYGLIRLAPIRVIDEEGKEQHCFDFARDVKK